MSMRCLIGRRCTCTGYTFTENNVMKVAKVIQPALNELLAKMNWCSWTVWAKVNGLKVNLALKMMKN